MENKENIKVGKNNQIEINFEGDSYSQKEIKSSQEILEEKLHELDIKYPYAKLSHRNFNLNNEGKYFMDGNKSCLWEDIVDKFKFYNESYKPDPNEKWTDK